MEAKERQRGTPGLFPPWPRATRQIIDNPIAAPSPARTTYLRNLKHEYEAKSLLLRTLHQKGGGGTPADAPETLPLEW